MEYQKQEDLPVRDLLQLRLLPRDVLFQILVRLGGQSRGKLSCVSKTFRSIFTDLSFIEFQRNWLAALNQGTTILFSVQSTFLTGSHDPPGSLMLNCTPEQFYTINYEGNQTEKLIQAKSVRHTDGRWFQYGRSMSFAKDHICFFNEHLELMVFNLIAGQHTALPKTPSGSEHLCALLGYDGVSGRHKVLKAEANFNSRTLKYWVLTLGVDETWRRIKSPVMFYLSKSFMNSVCINGVIYSYNKMYGHSKLVAFDVRSESFHLIPLPPATYEYFRKLSLVELDGRFAVMYVHQNKLVAWSLETARSCWKKHTFSFPLEKGVLGPGGDFFPRTFITATPAGEIVLLLMLNGTPSLWVLLDKFGPDPVWKEFRIRGLADIPTGMSKTSGVAAAQNIAHDHIHLE